MQTTRFSKELITKCQKYLKEKYGMELTEGKTDEYLERIADFYITLAEE